MKESERSFVENEVSGVATCNETKPALSISAEISSAYNLAMQQNFVPLIGAIRLTNSGNYPSDKIKLSITADPAFFEPVEIDVPEIPAAGSFELKEPKLKISADFLLQLKERIKTKVSIKIDTKKDSPAFESNVNLLAFNECDGYMYLPELISAFVQPNSPTIEKILAGAASILASSGKPSAISGYQSKDPGVVGNIAAAIFAAISSCQINYCMPPASFESDGQKIRFPEVIIENRLGTCLDLTLLFCACLEQAGLNSLVIFTRGHAFAGVWLKDESFPLCFVDNATSVKKRVELKEIMVFETTTVTGPDSDFSRAARIGEQKLREEDFIGCIDIMRCRSTHILPLPVSFDGTKFRIETQQPTTTASNRVFTPIDLQTPEFVQAGKNDKPAENRIDQWKRKLLDLSLRNKLLNYRVTAKTIQIVCGSLARLEDCLADGKEFRVRALPPDLEAGRSAQTHLENTGSDIKQEFIQREFLQHRLYSSLTETALEKNLLEVFRDSRNSLEEGGTNTLYLALGFLYWQEAKSADTLRAAPIILLPLEIRRNSVKEGFTICKRDEEAQINVTLLELLKQDFNLDIQGLDPLPTDDHGIDLDKTLNTIRQHILNLENWQVREEAVIGNFQFRKFLMYKDLELRSAKLLENPVVNHLVNGSDKSFPDQGGFPEARRLDQDYPADRTFCPLSADSSQLVAVHAAAAGRSFVLHGPPGTGKSQTITNIIAHSIAVGKSVLFVSEKAAALNVVYNRLDKIGLGPYCLELHSNKSRKAEVLNQLKKALDQQVKRDSGNWQSTAHSIQALRCELNNYAETLHLKHQNNYSFYKALSLLTGMESTPEASIKWDSFAAADASQLEQIKDLLCRIELLGHDYGNLHDSPWKNVMAEDWTPEFNRAIAEMLRQAIDSGSALQARYREIVGFFGSEGFAGSIEALKLAAEILQAVIDFPPGAAILLSSDNHSADFRFLNKLIKSGNARDRLRTDLLAKFDEKILQLNVSEISSNWEKACGSIWPLSWFRKRSILSNLQGLARDKNIPSDEEVVAITSKIAEFQNLQKQIASADDQAFRLLDSLWHDGKPDWQAVETLVSNCEKFVATIERFCNLTSESITPVRQALIDLYKKLRSLPQNSELFRSISEIAQLLNVFVQLCGQLNRELRTSMLETSPSAAKFSAISSLIDKAKLLQTSFACFRQHCQMNKAIGEAEKSGLAELMADFRAGKVDCKNLWVAFKKAYLRRWVEEQASRNEILRSFSGVLHNDKIAKFRKLDEDFLKMSAGAVVEKLAERAPADSAKVAGTSELGILSREIQKKSRHKPLRVLFTEISRLLPRIKPCFLMSPISVAQYLAPDHPPFDLVIFDEASQVPVWDAIGAIARGKDLIVVGDPKQLPPTSFFGRSESQEWEESELTEDMESILDDCLASGMPSLYLKWHYRSLHESLITFSNANYYDNGLYTFPAARFSGLGVRFHHLKNAVYDKGRSRTNILEAKAVVAEILRRLSNPELAKYSLGVVTFSVAQQTLIEDLLDETRRQKPELDEFFNDKCSEPVFVKNLESVQGDERDVIIFSICYGPDSEGRVSMNFGPLNKVGGERRLNVAITRARRELIVISSIKGDMISLSKTRAVGVKDLKLFLDYAERGVKSLAEAITRKSGDDFESPFEEAVARVLREIGYEIHTQVGCSGYRIDLAIVHPEKPGRYLLGVECDGAAYHSAFCARERDRLRQSVLESLGWKLHRIWSTEWWHNRDIEINRLKQRIAQCLNEVDDSENGSITTNIDVIDEPSDIEEIAYESLDSDIDDTVAHFAEWRSNMPAMPPEAFDQMSYEHIIVRMIEEITAIESPVSLAQVARKICTQFNISRATQRVLTRVQNLAKKANVHIDERHHQIFFWCNADQIKDFSIFRKHTAELKRRPEDICPDEMANAAHAVLKTNISMSEEELLRHTAQYFGFARVGQNVAAAIQQGLTHLCTSGRAESSNGKVSLI